MPIPDRWMQFLHDFEEDSRRAPATKMMHALQIRHGIPIDEHQDAWRPLLHFAVGTPIGSNWYNSLPRSEA